jgi:dTDP-glucose 4,6-dehydratase
MTDATPCVPWRRAVVTGGAGFLGSHLCERLLDSGVEVDCVDNLLSGSRRNIAPLEGRAGFRFVECDVSAPECLGRLPGPYDVVLHFACPASPADYLRLPLETLDAGSLGTRTMPALAERDRDASCSPRRPRCTAIPSCIRSARTTGAT